MKKRADIIYIFQYTDDELLWCPMNYYRDDELNYGYVINFIPNRNDILNRNASPSKFDEVCPSATFL